MEKRYKRNLVSPHYRFISELQFNDIIEEESGILVVQKSFNGAFLTCRHISDGAVEKIYHTATYRPMYIGYLVEVQ